MSEDYLEISSPLSRLIKRQQRVDLFIERVTRRKREVIFSRALISVAHVSKCNKSSKCHDDNARKVEDYHCAFAPTDWRYVTKNWVAWQMPMSFRSRSCATCRAVNYAKFDFFYTCVALAMFPY